eukprot:XP_014011287.1 PREDICTED: ankyrin repeat and KH domain-containing protein 1-like isoform X2 [Salmo salar]
MVKQLLLHRANKEHSNVSDYTRLSLATSGGCINILLNDGTEINSWTRSISSLGISPLRLAAMNGHVPAVKLLRDMGSNINTTQIETNCKTAPTLACQRGAQQSSRPEP